MPLVLDRVNGQGDVVVPEDDVTVLVQRRTEREAALLRQIVQLHVLPQDCKSGA